MKSAIIKSAVLGGLIVFIWGMISWGLLPFHKNAVMPMGSDSPLSTAILQNVSMSGVYVMPSMDAGAQAANGPQIFAVVNLEGRALSRPMSMIVCLIVQIIAAGLIAWLLLQSKGLKYGRKVLMVTVIGFLVGVLGEFPAWNWGGFPAVNVLLCIIDLIISWFLAGLLIAKFAKR